MKGKQAFKKNVKRRTHDYVNSILENTARLIEGTGSPIVANPAGTSEFVGGVLKDAAQLLGNASLPLDDGIHTAPPHLRDSECINGEQADDAPSLRRRLVQLDEGHLKDMQELKELRNALEERRQTRQKQGQSKEDAEIEKVKYNLEVDRLDEQFRARAQEYNDERGRLLKRIETGRKK